MKNSFRMILAAVLAAIIGVGTCSACSQITHLNGGSAVKLGVDNLSQSMDVLSDKRVGLITNATGVDSNFKSTIDILHEKTKLTALFAPEHGIRGAVTAGGTVGNDVDEKTGITVHSLYGKTKRPTPEMLQNVDVLVYDIQDVGARFYTYISTMKYAMQAAAENNKTFLVLDRPNPINGNVVQGAVLEDGFQTFVGVTKIPQRYGLTCAEVAQFINKEDNINCDLKICKMTGWNRDMYYEDTKLKTWVMPSPNIPTIDSAVAYAGTCLFEGTNLSEGRGTTRPFEIIGAPWIDSTALANKLNGCNLEGVYFRATTFSPTTSKFKDETCSGVEIHVTDRNTFNPVNAGVTMLYTIRDMYPNDFKYLDNGQIKNLTGGDYVKNATYTLEELYNKFDSSSKQFKEASSKYKLY